MRRRRRWRRRLTANASKNLVGRFAQQSNTQNHGIVALHCRVDQFSHDGRATRTERAVNDWSRRCKKRFSGLVGVSLFASICSVFGSQDRACPGTAKDSGTVAAAVCNGEDEDGRDGEKGQDTET